jgi:phage-related minor tail protein
MGGGSGGILSIFSGLFNAHGNVLSGGGISSLSGGVYDKPTFFGFDNHLTAFAQGGVLGEAGAEGVFPLVRTATGDLGVQAVGGGGGATTEIHIHNYGNQQVSQQTSTDNYGNKRIDVMIGDAAAKQMATPGSSLNRAMRTTTGLQQQVVRR